MKVIYKTGEVTFKQAWKDFWKGYFDFKGISTRVGFWWGVLIFAITLLAFNMINGAIIMVILALDKAVYTSLLLVAVISNIAKWVIFIPLLALATRRLRDVGIKKSAILFLIIGYIILCFLVSKSRLFEWLQFILAIVIIVYCNMPTGKYSKSSSN
ncbi:DUF805 domain-containing protein [Ligilactobacillus sp. LYQ135]